MNNVSIQKWFNWAAVSQKIGVCTTFLTQVWKGLVLRIFTGEKALKELTSDRVKKLSTIEIKFLSVRQLNAIGVGRFSEAQVKALPSDFFLKFKKVEQVGSFVTSLSPAQVEVYLSKMKEPKDTGKLSEAITSVQLKGINPECAVKVVSYLSSEKKKTLWKDKELQPVLFARTQVPEEKDLFAKDILAFSKEEFCAFLLKLEKSEVLPLLRKMSAEKASEVLEYVYTAKEKEGETLKKAIGGPFFEDQYCLNTQLPNLNLSCLEKLIDVIKVHLDNKSLSIDKTKAFPDSIKLSLLDNLLSQNTSDLKPCIEAYPSTLFESYLEGSYDEAKRLKCLNALIESSHVNLLMGRWKSFENPLIALNKLQTLTPDEIRSYWSGYNGQKAIVYEGGNKNVLRSYLFIEKGVNKKLKDVTNLEEIVFLQILPMLGKDLLKDATLLKAQIKEGQLEKYVKALCGESNSERCTQLSILGKNKYPQIIALAMKESLSVKEQETLLKILFDAKRTAGEFLSALKDACMMTNTSYEARMSSFVPNDERLTDFVGILINENFTGFPLIAKKLIGLNNSLSSKIKPKLENDLETLQTSLSAAVQNHTKLSDLDTLCSRVKSFRVVLSEVDKYNRIDFGVIDRVDDFFQKKIVQECASLEKETAEKVTAESDSFVYLNSKEDILKMFPTVKDLSKLVLKNGTAVYCEGSSKPAILFRFKQYLKENNV